MTQPALPCPAIGFRPFTPADLAMAAVWLDTPAVRDWWGDPATELGLLTEDLDNSAMDQLVVTADGVPFAYAQHYRAREWPAPQFAHLPATARAIDSFVGDPAHLGRGLGAAFLRALSDRLLAQGAAAVVVDPDPSNERAVRAYRRAGFAGDRIATDADGHPVLILERWPADRAEEPTR